jgi:hypothetical protein
MMLRFLRVRLARRSRDSSIPRRKTPVSNPNDANAIKLELTISILDVVVLTAMGEQAAIEAKEAPKTG